METPLIPAGEVPEIFVPDIYVPNYMSFHNENVFLGSYQGVRFKLTPDVEAMTIHGEFWYGPLCYENSTMDGEETFPLSEEGIAAMTQWLLDQVQAPEKAAE
jgi:hypothetical protein